MARARRPWGQGSLSLSLFSFPVFFRARRPPPLPHPSPTDPPLPPRAPCAPTQADTSSRVCVRVRVREAPSARHSPRLPALDPADGRYTQPRSVPGAHIPSPLHACHHEHLRQGLCGHVGACVEWDRATWTELNSGAGEGRIARDMRLPFFFSIASASRRPLARAARPNPSRPPPMADRTGEAPV